MHKDDDTSENFLYYQQKKLFDLKKILEKSKKLEDSVIDPKTVKITYPLGKVKGPSPRISFHNQTETSEI